MTLSRHPQLSEELLSAYIDNEVTDAERALIEAAMAADPAVAWEVESLRQTIQLLQALPPLARPRSFAINAIAVEAPSAEAVIIPKPKIVLPPKPTIGPNENQWWQSLMQFLQGGNLYLRNATAVAFTLFIVLFASSQMVTPYPQPVPQTSRSAVQVVTPAVVNSSTATRLATTAVAKVSGDVNTMAAPADADTTTTNEAQSAMAATSANATLLPTTQAALPVAKRMPQDDAADLTGGSGAGGAIASGAPLQGSGGLSELSQPADGPRFSALPGNPAPAVVASEQPIATPLSSTAAITSQLVVTDGVTATAAPEAVSAAQLSLTELATATETLPGQITATVTITPALALVTVVPVAETEAIIVDAPIAGTANPERLLAWAQIVTVLFTVVLGSLWWRSKG